jgi:hypothetical protein
MYSNSDIDGRFEGLKGLARRGILMAAIGGHG